VWASIWRGAVATVADLANLPGESLPDHGIGRLLHGADHSFSGAVRIPGPGSRLWPDSTFRRDPSSNRGMDRAATAGGICLGRAPRFLLRDRDRIFGSGFTKQVEEFGIQEVLGA
jgi:hypothetical protein